MNSLELHLFCLCVTDYKWGFFTFKLSIFFIPYHFVVFLFFSLLNTLTQQNHTSIIILSNLQHSAFNKISIGNISKSLTVKAFKKKNFTFYNRNRQIINSPFCPKYRQNDAQTYPLQLSFGDKVVDLIVHFLCWVLLSVHSRIIVHTAQMYQEFSNIPCYLIQIWI